MVEGGMSTATTQRAVLAEAVSFEEFLTTYDGVHAEWVDGKVHLMSPGNERQSALTRFLGAILQYWADAHGRLGETYVAPYTVRTHGNAAREPDVFFIRSEHRERVHGTYVEGPPDLVIEIVSPSSRGQDRGDKYYEYAEAGIPEYWLIDPERKKVEAHRLAADGGYQIVPLGDPPMLRTDALPGMWIAVEWLWREPLPLLPDVFAEWRP
jgi:Uma2 family endonuclease